MSKSIETIDWTGHLFRCSALSNITSIARGTQITEKQKDELRTLLKKEKLTPIQSERIMELEAKLNAKPELSSGAKTYLEGLWVEETFKRPKSFGNKYTEKGIEGETDSMILANDVLDLGLTQSQIDGMEFCKKRLENEYISGEPDIHVMPTYPDSDDGLLIDVKTSWNIHTFPHFKESIDPAYYAQGQGYMYLTGMDEFQLIYCLIDTPERLILDEQRRQEWANGFIEIPMEMENEIRHSMMFGDIPENLRVKRYTFKKDMEFIGLINKSVELSREYLEQLNGKFINNQNK